MRSWTERHWLKALFEAGVISCVALLLALTSNAFRSQPLQLIPHSRGEWPAQGARLISVEQARSLMESGGTVFVDLRPKEDYGRSHIPGAVNLTVDGIYESLQNKSRLVPEGGGIIFYGLDMEDFLPEEAAEILVMMGYGNIQILAGGWAGWNAAGLPVTSGLRSSKTPGEKRP
jgi:rhodanese-related sulfurtransferase